MIKKVIIHVGPSKTGSSAIQYWLNLNHKALKKQGVMYPSHDTDKNQVSSGNREVLLTHTADSGFKLCLNKVEELKREFSISNCHTLLLSSEFFFPLIPKLNECFNNVEFIVYLRNPINFIESDYNQRIKRHSHSKALSPSLNIGFGVLLQIDRMLQAENKPKLIIRPYANSCFEGGSLISDVLSAAKIDLSVKVDPIINTSYSFEALEFKRHCNHFHLSEHLEAQLDCLLQGYSTGDKSYSLIAPETYQKYTNEILTQFDNIVDKHNLLGLSEFRLSLRDTKPKPYRFQSVSAQQLVDVVEYVKVENKALYNKLKDLIAEKAFIILPNNTFYQCFGCVFERGDVEPGAEQISALVNLSKFDEAKFCEGLSEYLTKFKDEGSVVRYFLELANKFEPGIPSVESKLSKLRFPKSIGYDIAPSEFSFITEFVTNRSLTEADYCRSLAVLFEKEGKEHLARHFWDLAFQFRVNGPVIVEKLNAYRLQERQNMP